MDKILLNKILIVLVCVVCILLFFVPQGYEFNPGSETITNATWEASYVTDHFLTLLIYVPFPVLWVIFLLLKKNLVKRILKFLLLVISFLYIILSLEAVMFMDQDFEPYYGAFVPALIFPLLVWLFINDRELKKSSAAV